MATSKKIDMTVGSITKNVFLFAIPIVLGNVLQQLYTTVDALVIGNFCDYTSLALRELLMLPLQHCLQLQPPLQDRILEHKIMIDYEKVILRYQWYLD